MSPSFPPNGPGGNPEYLAETEIRSQQFPPTDRGENRNSRQTKYGIPATDFRHGGLSPLREREAAEAGEKATVAECQDRRVCRKPFDCKRAGACYFVEAFAVGEARWIDRQAAAARAAQHPRPDPTPNPGRRPRLLTARPLPLFDPEAA